jgi:hypothetical protein
MMETITYYDRDDLINIPKSLKTVMDITIAPTERQHNTYSKIIRFHIAHIFFHKLDGMFLSIGKDMFWELVNIFTDLASGKTVCIQDKMISVNANNKTRFIVDRSIRYYMFRILTNLRWTVIRKKKSKNFWVYIMPHGFII